MCRSSQLNIYNEEIKPIIMGNKGKDHPPECPVIGRPAVDDDSTLQVPLDNPDLQDSVDSPIMIDSECSSVSMYDAITYLLGLSLTFHM